VTLPRGDAAGPLTPGATDEGVCLLELCDRRMLETQLRRLADRLDCVFAPGANPASDELTAELEAYFAGTLQDFCVPTVSVGSPFQKRVWTALRAIPYGETRSYAEQARMIGASTAVRAVARANGDDRPGLGQAPPG
jgi:AraC family transcriptional regulator, regulatory protein of adaptative response / methylated-DNA-[protein]-cysteine methyltransferase